MSGSPCVAEPSVGWLAPAECPQVPALTDALRAQFGSLAALSRVSAIRGEIKSAGRRGYSLTLTAEVNGQTAGRTLSAANCAELVPAAVWLIVLAVGPGQPSAEAGSEHGSDEARKLATETAELESGAQPSGVTRSEGEGTEAGDSGPSLDGTRSSEPPEVKRASVSSTTEELPAAARDRPRSKAELHARIAGFGGVFAGAGAKVQGAIGLWASLSVGVFHTQLLLEDLFPSNESVAGGRHVRVSSLALGLSECALWGQRLRAGPCIGIATLRTAAHTKDFGSDVNRAVFWGVLDVGLQFLWPLTNSLELSLFAGAGSAITPRPRFTVAGVGPVATAARWSEGARIGLIYLAR